MMNYLTTINDWFWSPTVWLPPGKTWEDMVSTEYLKLPDFNELKFAAVYMTFIFIVLRYLIVEPFILHPIGRRLNIKENACKRPPKHDYLENIHLANKKKHICHTVVSKTAREIGWSDRQVERWLRQRRASERVTVMFKFCDCSWQLLYYSFYCIYGVYILYDKPWLWDMDECWRNYPFHSYHEDMWWYYMIPLGFYSGSTLTYLYQHQRKDAIQMLLHHLVTIFLLVVSWAVNLMKAGSLILLVHECADIPLLIAKIVGYLGRADLMDAFFVVFLLLWIVTRLGLFPLWIIRKSVFESYHFADEIYPIYYVLNGFLFVLLLFHVLWTTLIIKIIVQKFKINRVKDVRSDSEELSESELFDAKEMLVNGYGVLNSCDHKKIS